jgi:pyruvate,water dikinase
MQRELGRRCALRGGAGARPDDLWFVTGDELDAYVADPVACAPRIAERRAMREKLASRVPPFIVDGDLPPFDTWELRGTSMREPARVGAVLTGMPGCPGVARGRARVVLDPTDPGALEPGDVLVAPLTDPSWTPLFLAVEAVVVDVGAVLSHAVIVSRELGIPSVVSVTDATTTIPDGALIEVDGAAGTVRILDVA